MADDDREPVPEEAFSLLGHEVRLGILRAFFDRYEPLDPSSFSELRDERRLSYSELMDAVGMRDSGKFNYHLEKLRGVYVEKVGETYTPTGSAVALHQAVVANRPTESTPETFDIDADCSFCGTALRGRYEQESLTVDCPACDEFWGLTYAFPKNGLLARPGEDVFEALYNRTMYDVGLARTGQCPSCAGVVDVTVPRDRLDGERAPTVEMTCETCSWLVTIDVLSALQFDSRVAAALVELGAAPDGSGDPQATEEALPGVTGRVQSESPLRIEIEIQTPDGTGTVVVDGDLDVLSVDVV